MAPKTCGFGFLGIGKYAPERVLTNADLAKMVDTNDEWITSRSGIKERHIVADNEATSDMALEASKRALADAGMTAEEMDVIIVCTCTPDQLVPNVSCMIQERLGVAGKCAAFDLNAACTGFVYGLTVATSLMRAGVFKTALVVGAETISRYIDYTDRGTCVLFGDAAGAAIIGPTGPERGLLGEFQGADGSLGRSITIYGSGSRLQTEKEKEDQGTLLHMNGSEVFKFATRVLGRAAVAALEAADQGLKVEDVDLFIPHQANLRIIESASKKLGVSMDKFYVNLHRYGNTSAASIPMALTEARDEGRLKSGDMLALVAFGGGLTYGANIWMW